MKPNSIINAILLAAAMTSAAMAQSDEMRQWSDSTGRFKVQATLVEMRDGNVFLKTSDGKTMKIPVSRLSPGDQEFLKGGVNPFEEVSEMNSATANTPAPNHSAASNATNNSATNNTAAAPSSGNAPLPWSTPWQIDWDQVELLDRGFNAQWSYTPTESMELSFESQRAVLPKKSSFFEGMRRIEINPISQRAVAGYTVSSGVPEPQSRISLIDLPSGKAINSELIECDMCPLTILSDGSTVIMHGTGNERDGTETNDQLQLWRLQGKKVARSAIWIPFPDDAESFGKRANGQVVSATALADNKIVLVTDSSHIACVDAVSRQAIWHSRLSGNYAIEFSTDRKQMFLMDGHDLLVVDPLTGKAITSLTLDDKPHIGWPRIRLSPTGDKLLMTFINHLRVLDLKSGQFETKLELTWQGPIAPNGLLYPDNDYALFDNHSLFHIPSQILVCDYVDASVITAVGGTEFVGVLGDQGGLVVPTSIPHPKAESTLQQASTDPSVFLIHPGVEVSLNVSAVGGAYQSQVDSSLREAVAKAGYKVTASAPISLVASIKGPEQEAVSYIARGSYIATKYTTTVSLESKGKSVWSQAGNNVPGFIQTRGDQTIQQKLDELGKAPDLSFFQNVGLPKILQAPKDNQPGHNNHNALLISKFTLQGLVDSQ